MNKSNLRKKIGLFLVFCMLPILTSHIGYVWAANGSGEENATKQRSATPAGPQSKSYRITITGNRHFPEKELLKSAEAELERFRQKGYRKADIDDAAFRMRLTYLEAGFAFASVDYLYTELDDSVEATFKIEEGPMVHIRDINFRGNTNIESKTLQEFFSQERGLFSILQEMIFVESEVKTIVFGIRDYYRGEGFKDIQVKGPFLSFSDDRSKVDITLDIEEGPKYLIDEIVLIGDLPEELASELAEIKNEYSGKTYYPRRKLLLRTSLEEAYDAIGYADADIDVASEENGRAGGVILTAGIKSGGKIRIANVVISGNESVRESFIRSRLQLQSGDIYTKAKRRASFRRLFDTGLFAKVEFELAGEDQDDERDLLVRVAELPTFETYIEPGWGSYEQLRFEAGLTEKNLFGTGKNGKLDGLISTKGGNLTLSYTDPWLLHSNISMTIPLYYELREEPSYTSEDTVLAVLFSRKFGRDLNLITGYEYKVTRLKDLSDVAAFQDEDENYNKGTTSIQSIYDTRNDIFFPSDGMRLAAGVDLSLPVFGSEIELARLTLGGRYFTELMDDYILGLRYTTGMIFPLGEQNFIPVSERFFNGGDNTVRSYKHHQLGPKDASNEPLGGLAYNVLSIELRKRIYGNFAATIYVDGGNVSPNESLRDNDFTSYTNRSELRNDTLADYFKEIKYGIGIGFQYLLPVGPVRIDFAWKTDPDKVREEDEWVFHFSLGMAF